jgi:hypothetical protein
MLRAGIKAPTRANGPRAPSGSQKVVLGMPMAERLALGEYDQLHHFIAGGVWDATPVETDRTVVWAPPLISRNHPTFHRRPEMASSNDAPGQVAA